MKNIIISFKQHFSVRRITNEIHYHLERITLNSIYVIFSYDTHQRYYQIGDLKPLIDSMFMINITDLYFDIGLCYEND